MSKAMFGIVAGLALTMSTAWAGDEKAKEKAGSDPAATQESREVGKRGELAAGGVVQVASDHRPMTESKDVRASHEERWIVEREGYRDGGY